MNAIQNFVWGNKKKSQVATINGDYLNDFQLNNFKYNGYFFNDGERNDYYSDMYITTYYPHYQTPDVKVIQDDKLYSKIKVVVKQPHYIDKSKSCPNEYADAFINDNIIILVRVEKSYEDTIFYNLGRDEGEFILNLPEPQKIVYFYGGLGTISLYISSIEDFNTCASNGVTITISDPIVSYELIE
ncbi:hypothetical protein ACILFS_00995 [Capnocytophaga canimorsus]|uniref:hypothetical protein n=1 Tax=Capnocytophaga canimorsus TaxID=28188 RepID=UPI0037D25C77